MRDWADMAIADMERDQMRFERKALRCNKCGEILNIDKYYNDFDENWYCKKCMTQVCMEDNDLIEELISDYVSERWQAV